ncbi:unnamed protein product [Rotaria sp. Silwood2]|nr:unnamed protein product [Rotaria sp. Silwood2]CAF4314659.1 unnamed protein product [Rotaria sp. Silwood2]
MTTIFYDKFFDQTIPFDIYLPNIKYLCIKFPINDKFWSIVSSLNRLDILDVSFHANTVQSELQTLLNLVPYLLFLKISQDKSLPLQMSLFKYTCISCQVLWINVKNRENIIILVKNMINLRAFHIECEDNKFNKLSSLTVNDNDERYDDNVDNKNELVQWLKDHLPSTCFVVTDPDSIHNISIWI